VNSLSNNPEHLRLIAHVLSLHYEAEKAQSEIAKELGLSTAKVNRLIKQGREMGMVQITIKSPMMRFLDLEKEIAQRWSLKRCLVVPTVDGSPLSTLNEVGKGAANLLLDSIRDGDKIGISAGKTLSALIDNIESNARYDVDVVAMTGGVQDRHYTDGNHLATQMADKLGGRAMLFHAPLHATSEKERDLLMSVKMVRDVIDAARNANVAVVGIGSVQGADSTYYTAQPVTEKERKRLYEIGVRSEFLGHLIQEDGSRAEVEYNSHLVAVPPEELANIPVTIAIAAGNEKVEPVAAALNGGYFNALVIDEVTATALMEKEV